MDTVVDPNKSLLPESASCPGLGHTDKKNDQYTGLAQSQPLALSLDQFITEAIKQYRNLQENPAGRLPGDMHAIVHWAL